MSIKILVKLYGETENAELDCCVLTVDQALLRRLARWCERFRKLKLEESCVSEIVEYGMPIDDVYDFGPLGDLVEDAEEPLEALANDEYYRLPDHVDLTGYESRWVEGERLHVTGHFTDSLCTEFIPEVYWSFRPKHGSVGCTVETPILRLADLEALLTPANWSDDLP